MTKRAARREPVEAEQGDMLAERVPRGDVQIVPFSPESMMQLAITKGGAEVAEVIERLTRLKVEMQDREDRKELSRAIAKFQRECPPIGKDKINTVTGKKGEFSYPSSTREQIMDDIRPTLHACGLTPSWDSEALAGGMVKTVCTITHENGQSRSSSFTCPTSTNNPGMSDQQRFVMASTFGERESLRKVLGIVTEDAPAALVNEFDPTPLSDEQSATLYALAEEVKADVPRFLSYFGAATLGELPARRYGEAVAMLELKRKRGAP